MEIHVLNGEQQLYPVQTVKNALQIVVPEEHVLILREQEVHAAATEIHVQMMFAVLQEIVSIIL